MTATKAEVNAQKNGSEVFRHVKENLNLMSLEQDFINWFIEEFNKTHPTLQQGTMTLMLSCIIAMAEKQDNGWTDLRNEASGKIAQQIRELLESQGFIIRGKVRLPFV